MLTVLGNTPRAFKDVLERAQGILRATFGMELVELQSRAELDKEDTSKDNADGDRRKATGVKRKGQHDPPISHCPPSQYMWWYSRRQREQELHPAVDTGLRHC